MSKTEKIIKELERELAEFQKITKGWDLDKVQDAKLAFASMSFYQAQAFKKLFERLDEIENNLLKEASQ